MGRLSSSHRLGCVLVPPATGQVILQERDLCSSRTFVRKPAQPDLSLLSVVVAGCCGLVLPGWSVLLLFELCLSWPVLLPWRQKSVVCFHPDQK